MWELASAVCAVLWLCVQVVHDSIVDVCVGLNINDPVEMEEYTLFIRTGQTPDYSLL